MIIRTNKVSKRISAILLCVSLTATNLLLCSCGSNGAPEAKAAEVVDLTNAVKGERDNTPHCMVPEHPEVITYGNELVTVDASNASEGYIAVIYTGEVEKVKLQITCPNTTTYTYNLSGGYEFFPLTIDSGSYNISVFENTEDNIYSTILSQNIDVTIANEYGPYLYPNQYVDFNSDSAAVAKAVDLAYPANTDLDVVTNVYNYVVTSISYDTELASTVQSGYLPNVDRTLESGKGICLDYSSLMAAMLRSQGIPAHMEVGYAGSAYHAWISVYLSEIGWVNGIIEFDGISWELIDPTFASSTDTKQLKEFIGDGSNYSTKYIY